MSRHYVILPIKDVTQEMINACLETSIERLVISKNGNTILKYEGIKPKCLDKYDEVDIKKELIKDEWQDEID